MRRDEKFVNRYEQNHDEKKNTKCEDKQVASYLKKIPETPLKKTAKGRMKD